MIKSLLSPKWLAHLRSYNQLIVGYSGGLDSTVLLHVLASEPILLPKIVAVHINHGISVTLLFWEAHCTRFCDHLRVHLITKKVKFNRSSNMEAEARSARYSAFSSLITKQDCLILGHHLDDRSRDSSFATVSWCRS